MNKILNINPLYKDLTDLIDNTKRQILVNINSNQVLLNWNIGKRIKSEILKDKRAEYGKQVVDALSKDLLNSHGKGYSCRRNLFNMIKFYEEFKDYEIVQTLSAQLSWSHFIELFSIDDKLKQDFYIAMFISEGWSIRDLKGRISFPITHSPLCKSNYCTM
ncbi:MAG: hypothetical protein JXR48_12255 [Candidatus Delongbacteria bacterium]|nr:hypothetical protein [Candidatus Delongbacteria bacterium]MBN2835725.1 hypothetical protein [Candidatus Delongbacteria bacterium]